MKIRTQILLAVAVISTVITLGFATLVSRRIEARGNELAYRSALENARLISLIAARGFDRTGASFDAAVRYLSGRRGLFSFGADSMRVQLFDSKAVVRFDSSADASQPLGPGPDVMAALAGETYQEPVPIGGSAVAAAVPLRRDLLEGEVVGVVRVVEPAVGIAHILRSIAPEITALAIVAVLLAVVAAIIAGRSISAPLERLDAAARRIAAGERGAALPQVSNLEVATLTASYEDMRRELEDKRRIESMITDLSHELKNPIAAVHALAEALEDGALADPGAGPRLVAQVKASAGRLEAILADVLALARLEAQGLAREGKIEPDLLIKETVDSLAPLCREREVVVDTELRAPRTMRGDRVWLVRALANLLANAVENSPRGGRVRLAAHEADGKLQISITNAGEIPSALRGRLFERFATRRPEGTGLGLAIARSVAEAHGGNLTLAQPGPPEVELRLQLPTG